MLRFFKEILIFGIVAVLVTMAASEIASGFQIIDGPVTIGLRVKPVSTAALQISENSKGFLAPTLTTSQRDSISNPATGLEIFNLTTLSKEVFNGTEWAILGGIGTIDLTSNVTGILPVSLGGTGSDVQNFVDLSTDQDIFGIKNFTGKIKMTSTGNGLGLPNLTTAQRDAVDPPEGGDIIFNVTTSQANLYDGDSWATFGGGGTHPVDLSSDVTSVLAIANGGTGETSKSFVDLTTDQNISGYKNFVHKIRMTSNANGLGLPNLSTAERDAVVVPEGGDVIFNTTTSALNLFDGDSWEAVGAGGGGTHPVDLTSDVTGVLPIANGGTGSSTQNFVDLTTDQDIFGIKNFTGQITITSTGNGFVFPRVTTTERDNISTPVQGEAVYNTTTDTIDSYDGSTWNQTGSGGGGSINVSGASYSPIMPIGQASHGFSVADPIYFNSNSVWELARASNGSTTAQFAVAEVVDANTFIAARFGRVSSPAHGLTVGQHYFLSASVAGQLQLDEPSSGNVSSPIVFVLTGDTLLLEVERPSEVP